eukprot:CAMPEP_0197859620 /NCGR_PEP_ID=MMETSP1438-20131217/34338_1 /TAXON_ID=1461541 /ORGANISM="Pterosperma sp., Strain CCMP1384" /LENGTH=127 /DNA_ID=CAMNT_0043476177 /DNA_START=169 /DNA_END=549 /DNA_ORIENTATION=+
MSGDPSSDDFYKVLGVNKDASEQEIAKAYKKAAIKWHPDKNPQNKEKAEANFKKVSEAYEVLSSPEKRQTYDQFGKSGLDGAAGPGGGRGGAGMSYAQAQDIFEQLFGGADPFQMFFEEGGFGGRGG